IRQMATQMAQVTGLHQQTQAQLQPVILERDRLRAERVVGQAELARATTEIASYRRMD
ncbi:hypothetical protein KI387_039804, partial [Taxus chinensis]